MNCLVTGVSRGIGRATIAELMRQGHSVWGVSRTAVPDLREEEQGRFRHSFCDVGDSESRRRAAEEMDAAGFWPDAVILNAAFEYEEEKTALCFKRPPGRGVAKPEAVARYIANTVLTKRRFAFYYPSTIGLVCRFGGWMPDSLFERITRPLRR